MNVRQGLCITRKMLLAATACAVSDVHAVHAGGDDCSSAPVTIVNVGAPGMPETTTIIGNNAPATGPGADCLSGGSDLGWFEAFEIDTCARVTIDFCGQDPVSRPVYTILYRSCPCSSSIGANSFSRDAPCFDFNAWMQFDELPPGRYWYPVYTVPGDLRCEDFGFPSCTSNSECGAGFTCQDNIHPYTLHITAEAVSAAEGALLASAVTSAHQEASSVGAVATTSGPDIIVGRVFGCTQLGRDGPPGSGTIGMSCWTTACTIGDQGTDWYGLPDVNHPMISVNLFRLSTANGSDRLMQLGQSWLKHGFGTENANDCGFGCTPGGHFNLNNPGCSDTYAAQQFVPCDLGPRSMINPYTGVMPASVDLGPSPGCVPEGQETTSFPANDHRDHLHTPISHRLQVLDADLIPELNPGAEYIAEGQYIVPHEFVAGNGTQNNNVSYRRVTVAGDIACGGIFFSEVGDTITEQPAVNAWPGASQSLIEPEPLVDGRGFLAFKATDLGGNVWHYEYALYNMNMDRAMGSLRVPVSAGAVISDIGFYAPLNHDPEPHTENYSNTPWTASTASGAVTWSTEAFGVNPLANAVRFGTMYNFWFNADKPPQLTTAIVGLFKTGGSAAAATVGPGADAPPPDITWNADPQSPERTTRSLRFRASQPEIAAATPGQSAVNVTMIDLQNPIPPNLPANPPPNFSGYEFATCAPMTCIGGSRNGLTCTVPVDCPDGGTCTSAVEDNGCARWVGKPGTFLESQDAPAGAANRAAKLQCTPYYTDWVSETTIGPIAVIGSEIVPSSEYRIQTYAASCKGAEAICPNVSAPVTMYTRRSGDVEQPFNPPMTSTQPDVTDIAQLVNKFKNVAGAPVKAIAQMQPNLPELNADINALDIVAVVDAVKEKAYAFSGPCPCPSTVTCGITPCSTVTPCITAFGAGATCVKTCSAGTNDGDPCINNSHCPGGCCGTGLTPPCTNPTQSGGGFCRDRCGRCTP